MPAWPIKSSLLACWGVADSGGAPEVVVLGAQHWQAHTQGQSKSACSSSSCMQCQVLVYVQAHCLGHRHRLRACLHVGLHAHATLRSPSPWPCPHPPAPRPRPNLVLIDSQFKTDVTQQGPCVRMCVCMHACWPLMCRGPTQRGRQVGLARTPRALLASRVKRGGGGCWPCFCAGAGRDAAGGRVRVLPGGVR